MSLRLTQPVFWILASLATQRKHGYDILRDVADASGGEVALAVPTLYAALERMTRDGLIDVDGEEIVNGRARRYFRLSSSGRDRLTEEVTRLERATHAARRSLAAAKPASVIPKVSHA